MVMVNALIVHAGSRHPTTPKINILDHA